MDHYLTVICGSGFGLHFIACRCGWLASADENFVEQLWDEHRTATDTIIPKETP